MESLFKKYGWIAVAGVIIVLVLQFAPVFATDVTGDITTITNLITTYVETAVGALTPPTI